MTREANSKFADDTKLVHHRAVLPSRQPGKMSRQAPQQGELQSPAPGEEQPHSLVNDGV